MIIPVQTQLSIPPYPEVSLGAVLSPVGLLASRGDKTGTNLSRARVTVPGPVLRSALHPYLWVSLVQCSHFPDEVMEVADLGWAWGGEGRQGRDQELQPA